MKLFTVLELVDAGYSSRNFKTFLFGEEKKLINPEISETVIVTDFYNHIHNNWKFEDIKRAILDYDGNVLVYLNEYLYAKETGREFVPGNKSEIEHIMPNSGSYIDTIQNDAEISSNEEFRDLVNKLGNKILLEEKINKSLGNLWFRTKVSTKLENRTGYIDSRFPLANGLVDDYRGADKPYWKKSDILSATEKAADRITNFIFGD